MDASSAEKRLEEIHRLMDDAQRVVQDRGLHFIGWGLLIALALVSGPASAMGLLPLHPGWIWTGAIVGGWLFSVLVGRAEGLRAQVESLATKQLTAIWVGCGITLTILGTLGAGTGALSPRALNGAVAAILGLCYFGSAVLYSGRWVRILAVCWWVGAGLMLMVPALSPDLTLAALILVLQVLPGVVQYRRAKREAAAHW